MIKRNGTTILSKRAKGKSIAEETLYLSDQREYTSPSGNIINLSNEIDYAINHTELYLDGIDDYAGDKVSDPVIEVTEETTAEAAERLSENNAVALNFASAICPGGGFLGGATGQEEDLCRCSALYDCIKNKPQYYNQNITNDSKLYTDAIIYSPKVPFFRDKYLLLLEKPFTVSIITAPAPNLYRAYILSNQDLESDYIKPNTLYGITPSINKDLDQLDYIKPDVLYDILYKRIVKILNVAAKHGHKTIILGAWGCGAFCNDPIMISQIFMKVLKLNPYFEHICFAIYSHGDKRTFDIFKKECS